MRKQLYILTLILLIPGCSSSPQTHKHEATSPQASPSKAQNLQQKLLQHFNDWKGTPYRLGGQSRRGVDCSGFTQVTYRQSLGIALPRTTEQQLEVGTEIDRSVLRSGDLVFFKTGWGKRHVGIYLGDNRFMHASTSVGVTISALSNPYWAQRYWKSIRPDGVN